MPRKGDINADGVVDTGDINAFTQTLLGNPTLRQGEDYAGEYCDWSGNDDGVVDGRDIQGFVNAFLQ